MGEAGPEAIMPHSADGSLGVRMVGTQSQGGGKIEQHHKPFHH
jgi:phage-related minor tail protein